MMKFGKLLVAGGLAAAALGGAAAPAEAHIGPGGAIIAGLAGLGIGAAIASDHAHRSYDADYAPPPPPPPAYEGAVYGEPAAYGGYNGYGYDGYGARPGYGYGYEAPRCRMVVHWNGWQGRYVPVRRCW